MRQKNIICEFRTLTKHLKPETNMKNYCITLLLRRVVVLSIALVFTCDVFSVTLPSIWPPNKAWDDMVTMDKVSALRRDDMGSYYKVHITSNWDLAAFAYLYRVTSNSTEKEKLRKSIILLEKDISMRDYQWRAMGEIGGLRFAGTFDGQGHYIRYLFLDQNFSGSRYIGLFDVAEGATFKNIKFEYCYMNEHSDDGGSGLLAGLIETTGCTFENIDVSLTNMYVRRRSGFLVGYCNASGNTFSKIYVHAAYFIKDGSDPCDYGGLIGSCGGNITVSDSYISFASSQGVNFPKSVGGLVGVTANSPVINVSNCVIDMQSSFFVDNNYSAFAGYYAKGSPHVTATNVLVTSGQNVGPWNTCSLFTTAYASGASPFVRVNNCFVRRDWGTYATSSGEYRYACKNMNSETVRSFSNIYELWNGDTKENAYVSVVEMNRKGGNFTINPSAPSTNKMVYPVYDKSMGKLYGFTGRSMIESVKAAGISGSRAMESYSLPNGKDYVIMAGDNMMTYTLKSDARKWVISDNSTSMSNKSRSAAWTFKGQPTGEGELKFDIVERPNIVWTEKTTNQIKRQVTLKWKVANDGSCFSSKWQGSGEWHIYRNGVDVATVSSDKNTWIDDAPPLETTLSYQVYFVSSDLAYTPGDNITAAAYTTSLKKDPDFSAGSPEVKNGNVINTMRMANAQIFDGCEIMLMKWDAMSTADKNTTTADIIANAEKIYTTTYHYNPSVADDYQTISNTDEGLRPDLCASYRYMWVVRSIPGEYFSGKTYTTGILELTPADAVQITSISATKGWSTNSVKVKWQVENRNSMPIHYVVYRKEYEAGDDSPRSEWDAVYEEQSSKTAFSCDDNVLPGYVYRYCVRAYPLCEGTASKQNCQDEREDIGFAASRGTIMGTINYNSGSNATEGVDVRLTPEGGTLGQDIASYAMMFRGKPGESMPLASGMPDGFAQGEWTLQWLMNPDGGQDCVVAKMPGAFCLKIKDDKLYLDSDKGEQNSVRINTGVYTGNYIMLQHTAQGYSVGVVRTDETDGTVTAEWTAPVAQQTGGAAGGYAFCFGNPDSSEGNAFSGEIDEVRLWNGLLSGNDMELTYNRYLSGNEKNLMAYYTFDSGVSEYALDTSHPQGKWNNRNTEMPEVSPVVTADIVPDDEVLTYRGRTNDLGEYIIAGVPYTGEGTYYNIVPQKGAHQFQPSMMRTYVSERNLVREKADFTDVSSYKVEGMVYYENTNIPVDEVTIHVDGAPVIEDGDQLTTRKDGTFTVSVPIGEHVISLAKNGHTFVQKNYPSVGKHDFTNDVRDLVFWDNTLVKVAGRVAGGNVEYDKPVGMAASVNNIGTAEIVLTSNYMFNAERGLDGRFTAKPEEREFEKSADLVNSTAVAGAGTADDSRRIVIRTDAKTGEFSAMLPPVEYKVESIRIPSNPDVKITDYEEVICVSNPTMQLTDSLETDKGEKLYFSYNTKYKVAYYSRPSFEITDITVYDNDKDNDIVKSEDKKRHAFGERYYSVDNNGTAESLELFTERADGTVDYIYHHPVFFTGGTYDMQLKGFEQYTNKENAEQSQSVPLTNTTVEVNNGFSIKNAFRQEDGSLGNIQEDGFELDAEGKAVYQFKVGVPSLVSADDYARTMNITFVVNGINRYSWPDETGIRGVVFGQIPMGNDIITAGPDKVTMVLRDPPGSASYATWKAGSTHTFSHSNFVANGETGYWTATHRFGLEDVLIMGLPGCMTLEDAKSVDDLTNKLQTCEMVSDDKGYTIRTTSLTDISTSADPRFDGPEADVYVGYSTNIIIGKAMDLHPHYKEGKLVLEQREANTIGQEFATTFAYTQHDIRANLIPKMISERNNLLLYDKRYKSSVPETDKNFGKKGYYTWDPDVLGLKQDQDSVEWYNQQIAIWEAEIYNNEMTKVNAIEKAQNEKNYTIDSGSSITYSENSSRSDWTGDGVEHEFIESIINKFGVTIKGFGVQNEVSVGYRRHDSKYDKTDDETQNTFTYTLKETASNDIISVSVYDAYDGTSPIFYTRGGQTCGMWEPQQVTHYYRKGTEIMARTMKNVVPKLVVENPVINNIPAGETAYFHVSLLNESETKQGIMPCTLGMNDGSNPYGAVVTVGGAPLNLGIGQVVSYDKPLNLTVALQQSDIEKMDHRIGLILYDPSQNVPLAGWPANADTVYVEAHFVPASSSIELDVDTTYVNSRSDGKVTARLHGYDLNRANMMQIGLQYKSQNDQQWTTYRLWKTPASCVNEEDRKAAVTAAETECSIDMSNNMNYPEGTYLLRAYTMSQYADDKVYTYSQEVKVLKDMTAPKLMGTPQPANGIYNYDSDISITFNEDIRTDKIMADTAQYVTLMGRINSGSGEHAMSMCFDGGEGAVTEAQVAMPEGSVSIAVWMKWKGGAGEIISQKTDNGHVSFEIDDEGHVMVCSIDTIVSDVALLKDKWIHLAATVDCSDMTKQVVTASYVYGDQKIYLFRDMPMQKSYGEIAPVVIGKGFRGNMYDMTVWDYAMEDDKSHICNMPKTQYTAYLGAYWPMIEGTGSVAKEIVSKINLVMPDNVTWSSASENYSMRMEKDQKAYVDMNNLAINPGEDYLLQIWFRKDKTASEGDHSLLAWSSGNTVVGISGSDGKMSISNKSEGKKVVFTDYDMRDGKWHHLSVMAHQENNSYANIYIDAKEVGAIPVRDIDNLQGNLEVCGNFDGYIDELRVRKWCYTDNMVKNSMLCRYDSINARQMGLLAYFPFERIDYDEYNQPVTAFCVNDMGIKNCGTMRVVKTDPVDGSEVQPVGTTEIAPLLVEVPRLQRLNYDLSCDERTVNIRIRKDENPALYQGCTLYATVYDVEDIAGNKAGEMAWSFTVDMKYIDWDCDSYDVELSADQIKSAEAVVSFPIKNMTGFEQEWSIEGAPSWMVINRGMLTGRLGADETVSLPVSFTESMPIGTNHGALYLVDSRGISHMLPYQFTRFINKPEWSVDPHMYRNSMNMIGQVVIDGVIQSNTRGILAAFDSDDNCIGICNPEYNSRYGTYFCFLTVYGNQNHSGQSVHFRYFDVNTGKTHPSLLKGSVVTFRNNDVIGTVDTPFKWINDGKEETILMLNDGWNWVSVNVKADDTKVESVISDDKADCFREIVNDDYMLRRENGRWIGDITNIVTGTTYKINTSKECSISIVGKPAADYRERIAIQPGWNWLGANVSGMMPLDDAMADMSPEEGDVIKNQTQMATFANGGWVGNLKSINAGTGYFYRSQYERTKYFSYPSASVYSSVASAPKDAAKAASYSDEAAAALKAVSADATPDYSLYSGTMTVIAAVEKNGIRMSGCKVIAYDADGNIRAMKSSHDEDDLHLVYLVIHGEESIPVRLNVAVTEGQDVTMYETTQTIDFVDGDALGSAGSPFIINIDDATAIGVVAAENNGAGAYKTLRNGHIIINRNGQKYTVDGFRLIP